tara:strand:- start:254 stop:652 length:399 start_codon:yes stop_codon:yes gene_type:complete
MTYQNFYMRDVRTPETYYENKNAPSGASLERLRTKLEDLVSALHALKERSTETKTTPAYKEILDKEIDKAEIKRYKQVSKKNASQVIEALIYGTPEDAVDAITNALEYKIFCRTEPYLVKAGEEIENQVFKA